MHWNNGCSRDCKAAAREWRDVKPTIRPLQLSWALAFHCTIGLWRSRNCTCIAFKIATKTRYQSQLAVCAPQIPASCPSLEFRSCILRALPFTSCTVFTSLSGVGLIAHAHNSIPMRLFGALKWQKKNGHNSADHYILPLVFSFLVHYQNCAFRCTRRWAPRIELRPMFFSHQQ